jgi:DNA-binding NarL/FixJ family response regulator
MKKLVLVEGHSLMRLGWHTLLSSLADGYEVVSSSVEDIDKLADVDWKANLVVLGLPAEACDNHEAVAIVQYFLQPERILLLTESPLAWTAEDRVSFPSVYACIEKNASVETLMNAVRFGMDDGMQDAEFMDGCLRQSPGPAPEAGAAHAPDSNATPADPVVARDREWPCAMHDMRTSGQLVDAFEPGKAWPSSHYSQANFHNKGLPYLTSRQRQVLELLAQGHSIKMVARMLDISTSTAKGHTASLYRQLKVSSKGEAVYIAHQLGILPH